MDARSPSDAGPHRCPPQFGLPGAALLLDNLCVCAVVSTPRPLQHSEIIIRINTRMCLLMRELIASTSPDACIFKSGVPEENMGCFCLHSIHLFEPETVF